MKSIGKALVTLFFIFVFVAGTFTAYDEIRKQEVDEAEYELISVWTERYPDLKPEVATMMEDQKISKKEYHILKRTVTRRDWGLD